MIKFCFDYFVGKFEIVIVRNFVVYFRRDVWVYAGYF